MDKTTSEITLVRLIAATIAVLGGTAAFLFYIVSLVKDDFSRNVQDHWEQRYSVMFGNQQELAKQNAKLLELYKKKFPKDFPSN